MNYNSEIRRNLKRINKFLERAETMYSLGVNNKEWSKELEFTEFELQNLDDSLKALALKLIRRPEIPENIWMSPITMAYRYKDGEKRTKWSFVEKLISGLKFSRDFFDSYIIEPDVNDTIKENKSENKDNQIKMKKKIFISHSSKDKNYVEKIIDLLEVIGINQSNIFCSSFEGYGVRLGEDFLDRIKKELNADVTVLFILSNNYYESAISLCEMGAAWVQTKEHIPILIPPFDYGDIKGVIPTTHSMKINEPQKWNSLQRQFSNTFKLPNMDMSVWERKRNNAIGQLNNLINNPSLNNQIALENLVSNKYYDNRDKQLKEQAKEEWPNNFEMQVYYIQKQKNAIADLLKGRPMDIDEQTFEKIRKDGRKEWPNNFEMQLHYENKQIEGVRKLDQI